MITNTSNTSGLLQVSLSDADGIALAKRLHYPDCWDTAAYPTLLDALNETIACFQCSDEQHVSATPERTGIESRKGIIEAVGAVVKSRGSYSAMGNLYRFINTWRDEQIATPAPARELTDAECRRIKNQAAVDCDEWADGLPDEPTQDVVDGFYIRAILELAAHITGTAGGSA